MNFPNRDFTCDPDVTILDTWNEEDLSMLPLPILINLAKKVLGDKRRAKSNKIRKISRKEGELKKYYTD